MKTTESWFQIMVMLSKFGIILAIISWAIIPFVAVNVNSDEAIGFYRSPLSDYSFWGGLLGAVIFIFFDRLSRHFYNKSPYGFETGPLM